MQPILQSHSPSVLPSTATFHQRSLPGGTLPVNLRLFGKNVRFREHRLHKHRCAYSCAKKYPVRQFTIIIKFMIIQEVTMLRSYDDEHY